MATAFQADAFQNDAFQIDAGGNSFKLNAVLLDTQSASFTLDAVLRKSASASFTLDAFIETVFSASFTLDAILKKTTSASFTLNAVLTEDVSEFTLDAWIRGVTTASFTLKAIIRYVPVPPEERARAFIRVNNVDIAVDVIFADAEFTAQVNGQAGTARMRVRDLAHTYSFVPGDELTVDIGDDRVWGGWITKAQPAFFFKVDNTTDPQTTERVWILEGVDYNILFSKRFLVNKANPSLPLPSYPTGTFDSTMILDIIDRFLYLDEDDIETDGVTHVGSPNPDEPGNPGNPGTSWGAVMSLITRPTGAIFYIDPNRVLYHVDEDTPDASFELSDTPVSPEVGYRDLEILKNGSRLVNDALVWGAGTGSINGLVTFSRAEDAASIAAHGRWQLGNFTRDLFTQEAVDDRADRFVFGSPQNLRGGKDDVVSVDCTVFEPGLVAGQKVNFTSDVFGFEDVLPIRRMILRFPTGADPEFTLTLSHEVDQPWPGYEFWFPDFNFNIPDIDHGEDIVVPPILPPVGGCVCGVTDTFDRVVPYSSLNGFAVGESDAGFLWDVQALEGSVDGTKAILPVAANNNIRKNFLPPFIAAAATMQASTVIAFDDALYVEIDSDASGRLFDLQFYGDGVIKLQEYEDFTSVSDTLAWGPETQTTIQLEIDGTTIDAFVWQTGDTPPSTPTLTLNAPAGYADDLWTHFLAGGFSFTTPFDLYIDAVNIGGVDRCTLNMFDRFDRTVGIDEWGIATSGAVWTASGPGTGLRNVEDGWGKITHNTALAGQTFTHTPWTIGDFDFSCTFKTEDLGSVSGTKVTALALETVVQTLDGIRVNIYYSKSGVAGGLGFSPAVGSETAIPFTWVEGASYRLRWIRNGQANQIRVWPAGSSEPSTWDIEVIADGYAVAPSFFTIFHVGGTNTNPDAIWFADMNFDYEGKACYAGAFDVCSIMDDFNRSETGQWGNPSGGSGPMDEGWTDIALEGVVVGVDGSGGWADLPPTGEGLGQQVAFVTSPGGPAPDSPFNPPVEMEAVFQFDEAPPTDEQAISGNFTYGYVVGGVQHEPVAGWTIIPGFTEVFVANDYDGDFHKVSTSIPDLPAGTPLHFKWRFVDGGINSAKIWAEGDPEPGWQISRSDLGLGRQLGFFTINADAFDGAEVYAPRVTYDSITFCHPAGVEPGSGSPIAGGTCETAERTSESVYQVLSAFQAGTSRVYINGMLQRRGGLLDYTEDPANGQIVFNGPEFPEEDDTVVVCYIANGSL